jgi:hypothetical protein
MTRRSGPCGRCRRGPVGGRTARFEDCKRIQVDEIWAVVYAKQKNVATAKRQEQPIEGNLDAKHLTTSYAERSNPSVRMHIRRFTRLTDAFAKKAQNHVHAVALFAMYYNFVRIH